VALVDCPECTKPLSSEAYFCPSCGYPTQKQRKVVPNWPKSIALMVIVLVSFYIVATSVSAR
jgi:hypothetical protein